MPIEQERIEKEMHELENVLSYTFKQISFLMMAMESRLMEKTNSHKEYSNEALAVVGDAIIKAVIADKLYRMDGIVKKGEITNKKRVLEKNKTLHKVVLAEGIIDYSYNEDHFKTDEKDTNAYNHKKVVSKGHDPYIEAIVGAIYYDSDFEKTKQWIIEWLLPRLEKNKVV